jgi:hypothetical protein
MSKMKKTIKQGPTVISTSLSKGEKSTVHWGRNESKLKVNVFINSKVDSMMSGQFTPLMIPSLLDSPAINRMHEKDCNPDRISFVPLATATNGGNVKDELKTANKINNTIAKLNTMMYLDSGHFLHTKLSEKWRGQHSVHPALPLLE